MKIASSRRILLRLMGLRQYEIFIWADWVCPSKYSIGRGSSPGIELRMKLQSHSSSVACLPPLTRRKTRTRIAEQAFSGSFAGCVALNRKGSRSNFLIRKRRTNGGKRTSNASDVRLNRPDHECYGTDCPGRLSLADFCDPGKHRSDRSRYV